MKDFLAIVVSTGGKIDKYQDFDTIGEANAHVAEYGGFSAPTPNGVIEFWLVDEILETVTYDAAAHAQSLIPTWADVEAKQDEMFNDKGLIKRKARYASQILRSGLKGGGAQYTPKDAGTIEALLDYEQDIRINDETTHATPELALAALDLLTIPAEI